MMDVMWYVVLIEIFALGFFLGMVYEERHLRQQGRLKGEWRR